VATQSFKPEYDRIRWDRGRHADDLFNAWCEGRTGYPLVDAAMHQLNQTGYMHNRLRMVVASFLCKDLGLDWRRGEAYFAQHLNDFDLAANNGGWQWAASSGCDAQPYFRIFNPVTQSEKFDAQGRFIRRRFIRRYLPQLAALPDKLIHAPWLARPVDLAAAGVSLGSNYGWAATTRCLLWTMRWRARSRWRATRWSRAPEAQTGTAPGGRCASGWRIASFDPKAPHSGCLEVLDRAQQSSRLLAQRLCRSGRLLDQRRVLLRRAVHVAHRGIHFLETVGLLGVGRRHLVD